MSITNASSTQKLVTNAWIAFTGTAPSAANYAAHVAFVGTSGAAAYISFLSSHAKTIPAATLASNLLTNLGLSSVFTAAEALAYINSNLNNLGEAITRVSEATLNYVSDSTFSKNAEMLAAKAAYTATATTALTHSSNSANTSSAQAVTPAPSAPVGPAAPDGATIMLTTGVDKGAAFTGTGKADTFTASLTTVNDGDELDGGAGIDTLNLEINANVSDKFKSANIEKVVVTAFGDRSVDTKNFTGVDTFTTKGSTGVLTLDKLASAATVFGFEGAGSNSITANFVAGALSGVDDVLTVSLNAAKGVSMVTLPGFESAKISVTGANDLTAFTAAGVKTVSVEGSGSLNAKAQFTSISTLNATKMAGNLTTGSVDATTGLVGNDITADILGATVLLGSGNDNIGFINTGATGVSTVKLGDGNDKLKLNAAGAAVAVFGEAGDDTISAVTSALASDDIIDGGLGNDTLILSNAVSNNAMVLFSIENVVINGTADATVQTFTNDDSPSKITYINGAASSEVNLANLRAGSTVRVESKVDTVNAAGAVTIGFKDAEATSTIDLASGMGNAALTLSKISSATVSFGQSTGGASAVTTTAVKNLTLNASKNFESSIITGSTDDDKLLSVVINGGGNVTTTTIGAAHTNLLETVAITGAKAVEVTAVGGDTTKLTSVTLSAAGGTLLSDAIGSATNAGVLNVNLSASGNITGKGTAASSLVINSTKLGNVNISSTTGSISLGKMGESATEIGNITISARDTIAFAASDESIGNGTAAATKIGTVAMSSTLGKILIADEGIEVKAAAGITVSLTAALAIAGDSNDTTQTLVRNDSGNVTLVIAGETLGGAFVSASSGKGTTFVNASNKGGLKSTLTNAGTAGDGSLSTVSLGNAASGKSNLITIVGVVDTLNVTGGSGVDNVTIDADEVKTGTIALGSGKDILDFSSTTAGVAINLSAAEITFTDTGATKVAAGRVAQFDASSASAKVVASGFNFTVSGVSEVVGTAAADHIVANAEGTTIKGGGGADTIIGGAGIDVITGGDGADTIFLASGGADVVVITGSGAIASTVDLQATFVDTINGFTAGSVVGADKLQFGSTFTSVAISSFQKIASGGLASDSAGSATATITVVSNGSAADEAALVTFIGAALFSAAANQIATFAVQNGADVNIWYVNDALDGTATNISATDVSLIGVLVGVSTADLLAGNFGAAV